MAWHIITGEYPPQLGGVSDYTYEIAHQFANAGDEVHVWAPDGQSAAVNPEGLQVHSLPGGFRWSWLRSLDRGLQAYREPRNILIQYVPHMYGWKSMNLAFCWWIMKQRKQNVVVMFHEVAFPFRKGQPFRHRFLAVVHRMMAWCILRSVHQSFTSTDPYLQTLKRLGNQGTPVDLLRICSNIPIDSFQSELPSSVLQTSGFFTVGIFSNFSVEVQRALEPAIGALLRNPKIEVALLGPGEDFLKSLANRYPESARRIRTTGRLHVSQVGGEMRRCGALLQLYPDGASAARGTLIGAMASGVPLVTAAGPTTDQLLLESGAMLFSDESPDSIRSAIELLMENPGIARDLTRRALRLYREFFESSVIVSRIRETAARPCTPQLEGERWAALQNR